MAFHLISQKTWYDFFESGIGKEYDREIIPNIDEMEKMDLEPKRATAHSAGYDFKIPFDLTMQPGKFYVIPTGFNWDPSDACVMLGRDETVYDVHRTSMVIPAQYHLDRGCFLGLYPRSSLGMKYGFTLDNTIGIIDADYYNNPDNEGHILVGCHVQKELSLKQGDKLCQGIIQGFGVCSGEYHPFETRVGGVGSTGK